MTGPALPEGAARLWRRAHPYLPWVSLAVGLGGALLMERTPERAVLVAIAAVGAWVLLAVTAVVGGLDAERLPKLHQRVVGWGLSSALYASQSLVQLCLFFALPFYVRASAWTFGHVVFLGALLGAVAVAAWDPAYAWVFRHRGASLGVLGFASFAGLACVLPILGLPQQYSLPAAAALTAVGVPGLERLRRPKADRDPKTIGKELGLVAAVIGFAAVGGGFVPPAPLALEDQAIGTRITDHWVAEPVEAFETAPAQVACATAVSAPRGLRDDLVHEWRHEGQVVDRIPLRVRGGRKAGFRTWSIKKNLGARPEGAWACRVVTAGGRVVGEQGFRIGPDG